MNEAIKITTFSHKGKIYAECDTGDQLKACPFCGKKGIVEGCGSDYDCIYYSVGCLDKDCIGHWTSYYDSYATAREAVEAWNRRFNDE